MPHRLLSLAAFFLFFVFLTTATVTQAKVFITIEEVGDNVVVTAVGSALVTDLALPFSPDLDPVLGHRNNSGVVSGSIIVGNSATDASEYRIPAVPANFYITGDLFPGLAADSATGGAVGLQVGGSEAILFLPPDYGGVFREPNPINSSATFNNQSIASLNLRPGTYTWEWGNANPDSLTLFIVDPSAEASELKVTYEQVGNDVVATASGSADITELALSDSTVSSLSENGIFLRGTPRLFESITGPCGGDCTLYDIPPTANRPRSTPLSFTSGNSSSGGGGAGVTESSSNITGRGARLILPSGYNSGDPISSSSTFSGRSLLDYLQAVPGEYIWKWGGSKPGRLTITIVDPNADDDGDGTPNGSDAFPDDPTEDTDSDGDGIGDNGDAGGTGIGLSVVDASLGCQINSVASGTPDTTNAPGPAGPLQLAFTIEGCGSPVEVIAQFGDPLPDGSVAYKVSAGGVWSEIPGAVVSGSSVRYTVTDGGPLDSDGVANGTIVDPVATAVPSANPVTPSAPARPVPALGGFGLLLLGGLVAGLGLLIRRKR